MERRRPTARLYRRGAPPSCVASIVVVVGLRCSSSCAKNRSNDRSSYLAVHRSGALRQAEGTNDEPPVDRRRCSESGVGGIHHDASVGDAVSRPVSRRLLGRTSGYGHLALNGKTLRPICIDARGTPSPALGERSGGPIGLPPFIDRHLYTSGCGSIYRSRMSHLTVPHPGEHGREYGFVR